MTEGSADKVLQLSNMVVQETYRRYVMVCELFFSLGLKQTLGSPHLYYPRPGFDGTPSHGAHLCSG